MNNSQKAYELGQAIWYDNIHRSQLRSGEMKAMIDDGLIYGVTSNPSIFNAAIGKSADYDAQLGELATGGLGTKEILEALTVADIRDACDLFMGMYERSGGRDGFVSYEVNPNLAYDAAGTFDEAARLWKLIDRRNLMVKIPATKEGVSAIRRSIAEGININVTLIFSRERYGEVMEAYLMGLADRLNGGMDISGIASVASFFVSRIDSKVDSKLTSGDAVLAGKVAIANAKLAYQDFIKAFKNSSFASLAEAGAAVQRPLWASTSTKNPNYPDTIYVDALIGRETVNTVPPETLTAFNDHGVALETLERGVEEAEKTLAEVEEAGVSMQTITTELEQEGVEKFSQAWGELLTTVEARRLQVLA